MRSKDIGTRFETAVVNYLRLNGFGNAERRALAGVHDMGDITGTPGVAWECKAGAAAHRASDLVVNTWLGDLERERLAARAEVGVLVIARSGYGALRTGSSWAVMRAGHMPLGMVSVALRAVSDQPVRLHLGTAVTMLRALGFGDALEASL